MIYPPPKYLIDGKEYDLLSPEELKQRAGLPDLSTATLHYKMRDTVNELDYVVLGTFRYIIYNEKAQALKVDPRGRKRHDR